MEAQEVNARFCFSLYIDEGFVSLLEVLSLSKPIVLD